MTLDRKNVNEAKSKLLKDTCNLPVTKGYFFNEGVSYAEKEMAKEILDIVTLDGDEYSDGEIVDLIVEFLKQRNGAS